MITNFAYRTTSQPYRLSSNDESLHCSTNIDSRIHKGIQMVINIPNRRCICSFIVIDNKDASLELLSHSGMKPKLLDQVRQVIRKKKCSYRTTHTYAAWTIQCIP